PPGGAGGARVSPKGAGHYKVISGLPEGRSRGKGGAPALLQSVLSRRSGAPPFPLRSPALEARGFLWERRKPRSESGRPLGVRGEALPATAFPSHVRVGEGELLVQAGLEEVDRGAVDQGQAVGVHVDADPAGLEHGVALALVPGQLGQVAPARAARAAHAEAQPERRRIGGKVAANAFEGGGSELDGHASIVATRDHDFPRAAARGSAKLRG